MILHIKKELRRLALTVFNAYYMMLKLKLQTIREIE